MITSRLRRASARSEIEVTGDAMDAEDFRVDVRDAVSHWVGYFNEQAAISRQVTADRELSAHCAWPPLADRNLRWVLLHMIEETARHAGHADIIRETSTAAGGHSGRMTRRKLDDHVL